MQQSLPQAPQLGFSNIDQQELNELLERDIPEEFDEDFLINNPSIVK
jgi:hypothetical protein